MALGSEVAEVERAEEAEAVGRWEGEGRAEGELVPRRCTAPAFGPDTLLQSAPLWHVPEQALLVSPVVSP